MKKRFICFISAFALLISMLAMPVMADGTRVVTLGQDLTDEQEAFIINYFGVDLSTARVIYVNNQQERAYVGSWIPIEQIGDMTISSAYVQPTNSGGIQVKTANLTYVTGNMIASVLSTAGVKNCNIVAAAPFPVSGTGALTGVMVAYQEATGQQLDESRRNLAVQEFTVTQQASESIGEQEALQLVNAVKMEVIQSGTQADNTAQLQQIVDQVVTEMDQSLSIAPDAQVDSVGMEQNYNYDNSTNIDNSVTTINNSLTEEDRAMLLDLAAEIAKQQYQYEDVKETLQRVEDNLKEQTNISISIDNSSSNTSSSSSSSDPSINNDNSANASADNSIDEESILDLTNDAVIAPELQDSTREEDIEAIREAVEDSRQEEPAAPADAPYVMDETFYNDTNTDGGDTQPEAYSGDDNIMDEVITNFPDGTVTDTQPVDMDTNDGYPEDQSDVPPADTDTNDGYPVDQPEDQADVQPEDADVMDVQPVADAGWQVVDVTPQTASVPADMQSVWDAAQANGGDMSLTAAAYLGQAPEESGSRFLCVGDGDGAEKNLYVVTVDAGQITDRRVLDLEGTEQGTQGSGFIDEIPAGGWIVTSKPDAGMLPEGAATAFGMMMSGQPERSVTPVMLLATRTDAGTEYAILCCEMLDEQGTGCFEIAFIHIGEDASYQYSTVVPVCQAELGE